jgi:hypothetical protein
MPPAVHGPDSRRRCWRTVAPVVPTEPDASDLIATALIPAANSKLPLVNWSSGLVLKEDHLTESPAAACNPTLTCVIAVSPMYLPCS